MNIRFSYQALTAGKHEVGILADFTEWKIIPLKDIGGLYIISFPLNPGRYLYKFIVDGVWIKDPANPDTEADPFGGENSVLWVHGAASENTWDSVLANIHKPISESYIECFRFGENELEFRFSWYLSLADEITLHCENGIIPLEKVGIQSHRQIWHCNLKIEEHIQFYLKITYQDRYLFFGAEGLSPQMVHYVTLDIRHYEVFKVPQWVQHSVIYQIFTDRFCNGDPSNDPTFTEHYYEDVRTPPPPGQKLLKHQEYYHLVTDWYDISGLSQSPYKEEGVPDWWSFYGGDICGVKKKLDYLQDLGITAIYFNPLWQAKSNHKYDAADFCTVDPHFASTSEMQDFIQYAHANGIKVILDVAFNHSGESFWAFRDCVEKGDKSPYWNWYDWYKWPLPKPLPCDFQPKDYYQCWWGIKDMPDLNFDLARVHPYENYIRDINNAQPNMPLVQHILDSVKWWLIEIGIDGFRLDVPDEVPWWFWSLFRKTVKQLKPDAWLVGEIWNNASSWLNGTYFDSVMNYAYFKSPVMEFFVHSLISKAEFCSRINEGLASYPDNASKAMMNLLGSHDTLRIMELAEGDVSRVMMAVFFQMTFIGAPHIYYGDEIAMRGGKDPDNRRPMNWNWEAEPTAVKLRQFYQDMISLRASDPLWIRGSFSFVEAPEGLLVYSRKLEAKEAICLINYGDNTQKWDAKFEVILQQGNIRIEEKGIVLEAGTMVVGWVASKE